MGWVFGKLFRCGLGCPHSMSQHLDLSQVSAPNLSNVYLGRQHLMAQVLWYLTFTWEPRLSSQFLILARQVQGVEGMLTASKWMRNLLPSLFQINKIVLKF